MSHPIKVSLTTLHCLPIFSGIPDDVLQNLVGYCSAVEYKEDEDIIKTGDVSSDFYLILSGSLRVILQNQEGDDKEVVLAYLQSGEFFGELSMIDAGPRSATVIANTDCCVVSIKAQNFRNFVRQNIDVAFFLMRNLVARLRYADDKIRGFALDDVASRVLTELKKIAVLEEDIYTIRERISRQDLAKVVGASREMVGRAIRDLEIKKKIVVKNGLIQLNK